MATDAKQEPTGDEIEAPETTSVPRNHESDTKWDKAAKLLEESGHSTELTPENNSKILRKIDLHILPIILAIYFLQSLDKTTLAYGSVFGLIDKTHLHGLEYSWLGSVVYLAQLVCQPLVAFLLVKVPLGKFLAVSIVCWGTVLSAMTAAGNFPSLLVCRMLLGAFESGLAPAFIALTQMWYRRREQPLRLGAWYAMNGITNIFGSLLSWGLGHIGSDKLAPYQIIFLFCGLITVCFSGVVLFFLPDSPLTAKFLDGDEKLLAVERLRANQQGIDNSVWKWDHVKEAVLELKTWMWLFMLLSVNIPSGGISTFGPLIIKSFGYDSFTTILFNMPFGAIQIIATLGGAWVATVMKLKAPILMFLSIPPIIGCVILLTLSHTPDHKGALLVGYYLISVYPGITPLIYSWSAANTGGETKKKVTTGIMTLGQTAGSVIGPTLFTTEEAPGYRRGLIANLILFIVLIILYTVQIFVLKFMNRSHAKKREALGKVGKVVDVSLLSIREKEKTGDAPPEAANAADDRGLLDTTDWKNEDFIYVY